MLTGGQIQSGDTDKTGLHPCQVVDDNPHLANLEMNDLYAAPHVSKVLRNKSAMALIGVELAA